MPTLGGTVINKDTKKGIPFVLVRIIGPNNFWKNTGTGPDGTWLVEVPVNGAYYVEIRSMGYQPWSGVINVPPGRKDIEIASMRI